MTSFVFSGVTYSAPVEGTTNFALTSDEGNAIGYLSQEHIHVYNSADGETWIQYVQGAGYAFNAEGTEIILVTPTVAGQQIRILRNTPMSAQYVTFSDGSLLTSNQLNKAELFSLYCDQELSDGIKAIDDGGLDGRYVRVTGDTMTGTLNVGGSAKDGAENGVSLREAGLVQSSRGVNDAVWSGYTTGSDDPTSLINANGSAEFASTVKLNGGRLIVRREGNISNLTNLISQHGAEGSTTNTLSLVADGTLKIGTNVSAANTTNIVLNPDGSATFANDVRIGLDETSQTVVSKGYGFAWYDGTYVFYNYDGGGINIGTSGASDQANIKLKPTGTAKFLSDKSNIELNNDYALQVYRKSNKDNDTGFALFSNYQTIGRKQIEFYTNGSALFRGMVEAQQGIKFGDGSVQTTAGGGGGGGATVTVSDTAPVGQKQGDLWWDSLGAALYLWYVDPDVDEQWVPATPTAGDIAQTYVKKAGDTMTGQLTVKVDNSSAFLAQNLSNNSAVDVRVSGGHGFVDIYSNTDASDPTISLDGGSGAATFAGDLNQGESWNRTANQRSVLITGGAVYAQRNSTDGSNPVFRGTLSTTDSSDAAITSQINADGSAIFAGGADLLSTSSDGLRINNEGELTIQRSSGSDLLFRGYNQASNTIAISADGVVKVGDYDNTVGSLVSPNGGCTVKRNSVGTFFRGLYQGDEKFKVEQDGSATFAAGGTGVNFGNFDDSTGHVFYAGGAYKIRRNDDNAAIQVFQNGIATGDIKAEIKANGSATFKSNVNVDSRGASEEAVTARASSTSGAVINAQQFEAGGLCYRALNAAGSVVWSISDSGTFRSSGSVLLESATGDINVGDRLEQAQETFQKLRAAVDNATDFAQLKAAMQAALSGFEPGLEAGGLK